MLKTIEEKIYTVEDLAEKTIELKKLGEKIVFTNGCFDIIHTGHTQYLYEARKAGDALIVAVNSDFSVRSLKGENRPINPIAERMIVLASLFFVDYVVPFEELDPYKIISKLKPDILIKGGDWPLDKIIGRDIVENNGGKVFTIPEIPGQSTTGTIQKILNLHIKKS
ncbi:D-glycero-beta-D-manno-heptose 1-phosphate adenylyltransferase [bacterium]|nr:D-glycero-beta-D-manno-heptose 1-phosphate adenylyltransferase [bacterium]